MSYFSFQNNEGNKGDSSVKVSDNCEVPYCYTNNFGSGRYLGLLILCEAYIHYINSLCQINKTITMKLYGQRENLQVELRSPKAKLSFQIQHYSNDLITHCFYKPNKTYSINHTPRFPNQSLWTIFCLHKYIII